MVTKPLPGDRWLQILTSADCRVEVSQHEDTILSNKLVKDLIGKQCDGVIGQLTEVRWLSIWALAMHWVEAGPKEEAAAVDIVR